MSTSEQMAAEIIEDFLANENCSCLANEAHPCPRCQVTIDEARAYIAAPGTSTSEHWENRYKVGMLRYEFDQLTKVYVDYVELCNHFKKIRMERDQRKQLITSLKKIISEHRKTVNCIMDKLEG